MKWHTKNTASLKFCSLLLASLTLVFTQASAWALGTNAGTVISNTVTLDYNAGFGSTTLNSNTVSFTVDNKVNLVVLEANSAVTSVVPGQSNAVTTFTITNNGNATQDYLLTGTAAGFNSVSVLGGTDNFDATGCNTFVENGAVLGFDALDTATFIDELAANGSRTVYVVCNIPTTQVNGDQSITQLTATTRAAGVGGVLGAAVVQAPVNTQAGVEVVFADPLTSPNLSGTDPGQLANDAIGFARDAFRVATITITKSVTPLCDPINGPSASKNIPDAAVRYAVTISNPGTTSISLNTIVDTLAGTLLFDNKLNSGVAPASNCVAGNIANSLSNTGIAAVTGIGAGPSASPTAADAVSAGVTIVGQVISVDFNALSTSTITAPAAATLAAGNYITVHFNAFVR